MKQVFYTIAFLSAFLLWACESDLNADKATHSSANDTIRIGINTKGISISDEGVIEQLRFIVFKTDGTQYLNIAKNKNELDTSDTQEQYKTTITVPKDQMTIYIIANETQNDLSDVSNMHMTKAQFDAMYLSYTHEAIKAPFVLFGSGIISSEEIKKSNPEVNIALKRTVSKISLQLTCDYSDAQTQINLNNGTIDLQNAYVINLPDAPSLVEGIEYAKADDFATTPSQKIEYEIKDIARGFTTKKLDFYIPEHILSETNYQQKNHTAIMLHGVYTSEQGQIVDIKYTIPVGDGIDKLTNGASASSLSKADLTVTRNTHYQIAGTIKSQGEIDGISMIAKIMPWKRGESINIKQNMPYLNISHVKTEMITSDTKRVYFWSNQPLIYIDEDGSVMDPDMKQVRIVDYFENITGNDRSNFVLFTENNTSVFPGFVAYNGYFDLRLKQDISLKGGVHSFSLLLHAGKLSRTLTVDVNIPISIQDNDLSIVVAHHDTKLDGSPRKLNTDAGVGRIRWWQALGIDPIYENKHWLFETDYTYRIGCNNYAELGAPQGSWRTPTLEELKLIQHEQNEIIEQGGDPFDETESAYYWSSEEEAEEPSQAQAINFKDGAALSSDKSNDFYVRCIRK